MAVPADPTLYSAILLFLENLVPKVALKTCVSIAVEMLLSLTGVLLNAWMIRALLLSLF